ncbi:MAG TPA: alpha/beta hydrolase [Planctomycetota bacterium]|nr:alpha/beta hydrolase [Planctomycetota bacterium]
MSLRLTLAAALVATAALAPLGVRGGGGPEVVPDVVYGHKDGMALTLDVIRPATPKGGAVLWIQSGGWYSAWMEPSQWVGLCKPYLDRGLTVFIVRHGSAPRYAVPDAVEDVRRAVRFVRLRAKSYQVDPERLAVMGTSAGGQLALMLGTTADEGDPKSPDEVLRQSSRVATVIALYPPTDLRGWTTDPPEAIRKIPALKAPLTFDPRLEPEVSPLLKVSAKSAPTLLFHGDKDGLVPIDHSKNMQKALEEKGVKTELVVVEGGGHGFTPKQNEEVVAPAVMRWLEARIEK